MKHFYLPLATLLRIISIPLAVVGVFTVVVLIGFFFIDVARACSLCADDLEHKAFVDGST